MLLISDCSRRGVQAVARIAEMVRDMELKPGRMGLIINRAPNGVLDDGVKAEIEKHGLELLGVLPQDDAVYRCDCVGEPSAKLPESDPMKVALKGVMQSLGL
jgi:CO dehydrogenase maturation factor